jgi:dephospho-CoA kinase
MVHPRVRQAAIRLVAALAARPQRERPELVVQVVPLLFEVGLEGDYDEVWVVACTPEQQIERLIARDGGTRADALARIEAQWPIARKVELGDRVIENFGTRAEMERGLGVLVRDAVRPDGSR